MTTLTWSRPSWISAAAAIIVALVIGLVIGQFGLLGTVVVAGGIVAVVAFLVPETAFVVSLLSIVVGQMVRWPVAGGENSVILNDLLLPVLLLAWGLRRLASRQWPLPSTSLTMPLWLLFAVLVASIFLNAPQYTSRELLSGSLYLIRWLEYASLLLVGYEMMRTLHRARRYLKLVIWIGVILSILGFLQLRIYPDFSFMVPQGWDPHVGRLLSTWFDPNFLGGYLALLITISLGVALAKPFRAARWWWLAIAIMTVAVVFTFSRSAYVALAVGAGLVTLVRSRTVFFLGLAAFFAVVLFVPRVNERVIGIRTLDETAKLRLVSWGHAWTVISDHLWTGVGYNLYRYVQVDYGFLDDPREHSASGSDSSLLTIWVTAGLPGLLLFLWLYGAMLREAWKTWRQTALPAEWRGFGLGLGAGLLGLLLHSQFVNSLFYPHIMQAVWILLAMAVMVRQSSPELVRQQQST
ncbi:MAG: O-antigen ligase family protein [Candidatus Kerfeldbacteria bacterium]|nr:O-antigen ligase family protein [Candidatus Kerfeldbacteria bacterium]